MVVAIRQRAAARRQEEAFSRIREVATIVEEIRMNRAGRICWILLLLDSVLLECRLLYVETVGQRVGLGCW